MSLVLALKLQSWNSSVVRLLIYNFQYYHFLKVSTRLRDRGGGSSLLNSQNVYRCGSFPKVIITVKYWAPCAPDFAHISSLTSCYSTVETRALLQFPGSIMLKPQGLCTCYLCNLESFSLSPSGEWLLLSFQVTACIPPPQGGFLR